MQPSPWDRDECTDSEDIESKDSDSEHALFSGGLSKINGQVKSFKLTLADSPV